MLAVGSKRQLGVRVRARARVRARVRVRAKVRVPILRGGWVSQLGLGFGLALGFGFGSAKYLTTRYSEYSMPLSTGPG